jgi:uncharacterized cupin superfamily protein
MRAMTEPAEPAPHLIVNVDGVEEKTRTIGDRWGASYKPLTPSMRPRGGSLGLNYIRLPGGRTAVPFHHHRREDEVFFVVSGRGVLRYGDELFPLRAGDCVSCPAKTGIAHQIANPFEDDLVYLAIGPYDADEVCGYPDTGKVLVRGLQQIGKLETLEYLAGEPATPKVFELIDPQLLDE